MQERQPDKKAPVSLKLYAAAPEAALLSFVDAIADNRRGRFFDREEWVDEEQVIRALCKIPAQSPRKRLKKRITFTKMMGSACNINRCEIQ